MSTLSEEVKADLREFLLASMEDFRADAVEYDGMDLTIGVNEEGTKWNYQTGDNSYTGGAYGLPLWAVVSVQEDSEVEPLLAEIIDQLEEGLAQVSLS